MTKIFVSCPVCDESLGKHHMGDFEEVISRHIIYTHPQRAKDIVEIGMQIEKLQAEFKEISGISSRELFFFVNQNVMRALGYSEKDIEKHLKREW